MKDFWSWMLIKGYATYWAGEYVTKDKKGNDVYLSVRMLVGYLIEYLLSKGILVIDLVQDANQPMNINEFSVKLQSKIDEISEQESK